MLSCSGRECRRRKHLWSWEAFDPVLEYSESSLVQGLMSQGRHLHRFERVDAHKSDRPPNVIGGDHVGLINSFIDQHLALDQTLPRQRRVKARIEIRHRPARPVAVGAVSVEIGSGTLFQTSYRFLWGAKSSVVRYIFAPKTGFKEPHAIPPEQLVFHLAISERGVAVDLPGFDSEHSAGFVSVT